jgi:hypothetical protein
MALLFTSSINQYQHIRNDRKLGDDIKYVGPFAVPTASLFGPTMTSPKTGR